MTKDLNCLRQDDSQDSRARGDPPTSRGRKGAVPTLDDLGPEVVSELKRCLGEVTCRDVDPVAIELERLHHRRVLRARTVGTGTATSVVIKRLNPRRAERNRRLARRWLPWLGLDGIAPALLGAASALDRALVWQIYEDLPGDSLQALQADRECIAAAVDAIAEIHVRSAGHPVVSECRRDGEDFGIHYFTSNVQDALRLLESLRPPVVRPSSEQAALRDRLCRRMQQMLDSTPRRAAALAEDGGPDTLLHGDLWAANILVVRGNDHVSVQLIDWDHVGAGPVTYDLSIFLAHLPMPDRRWILDLYGGSVAAAGWRLPDVPVLNLLFETAELARCANRIIWPAIALLHDGTDWGFLELGEIEEWLEAIEPLIPIEAPGA